MSRAFFTGALDCAATYWRIWRRDGVAMGFTAHDRDLVFGGLRHRAAPGMVGSALRLSLAIEDDEAAVDGALSHEVITEDDLAAGRYDGARMEMGLVDWETLDNLVLYRGRIDRVTRDSGVFSVDLASIKADLEQDPIPVTGPTCRARFCGPGCNLGPASFESRARIGDMDLRANTVTLDREAGAERLYGTLRFVEGPQAGEAFAILAVSGATVTLDRQLVAGAARGSAVILRQGCDKTIATCSARFANAVNFRGEPFVPGADILARTPVRR